MEDRLVYNSEDIEQLQVLMKIRNNIMNYVDIEKVIDIIGNTIDESEDFSFRSKQAKEFINKNKPVFVMKLDNTPEEEKEKQEVMAGKSNMSVEQYIEYREDFVASKLDEQVLSKIGSAIRESIKEDTDLDEILSESNLKFSDLLVTNIYAYKLSDPFTNIINLSLFV